MEYNEITIKIYTTIYYEKYDKIRRKNFHGENQTVVKSNVS